MLTAREILDLYEKTPKGDYDADIDANVLREVLCYALVYVSLREKTDGFTINIQSLSDIPDELEKEIDKERKTRWKDVQTAMMACR